MKSVTLVTAANFDGTDEFRRQNVAEVLKPYEVVLTEALFPASTKPADSVRPISPTLKIFFKTAVYGELESDTAFLMSDSVRLDVRSSGSSGSHHPGAAPREAFPSARKGGLPRAAVRM